MSDQRITDPTAGSAQAVYDATPRPKKYAIALGPSGWLRWDNDSDAWVPIPGRIAQLPEAVAIEYCAGLYGVPARRIRVDALRT